jgi:hypothetical protein
VREIEGHAMNDSKGQKIGEGSLLEGLGPTPIVAPRVPLRERFNRVWDRRVTAWRVWMHATPQRAARVRRAGTVAAALAVVGAGVGAYLVLRPTPVPDYIHDPFDDVLDFTLLTDGFNDLPIEERLRLLRELVSRFNSMDGSDSELVAAFAAGISGKARKQLEKNASKLILDVLDREALVYEKVPPEERGEAAEKAFVALFKTMDALDGRETTKSDEEIVAQGRDEAERGKEWIRKQDREKLGRDTGRMLLSVNDTIAKQSSAQQRGRMGLMMRDMTRQLRGEPVGK